MVGVKMKKEESLYFEKGIGLDNTERKGKLNTLGQKGRYGWCG
jgi:hypothetical protein